MLFQVYGSTAPFQWAGLIMVFVSLIVANEFARRSKVGGIICFIGLPAVLTAYFVAIYAGAAMGADWALNNPQINLVISIVALIANVLAFAYIMYRAKKQGINPYKHEVFRGTRDFDQAMERAE